MKHKYSIPGVFFEVMCIFILIIISKLEQRKKDRQHRKELFVWQVKTRANKRSGEYSALKEYASRDDFDVEILRACVKKAP